MNRLKEKAAGILLAAGESRRMGRIKQLLPVGQETLIEHVLAQVLASRLDAVVLVLGHQAGEIRAVIEPRFRDPRLCIIQNYQYRQGISSSIAAGVTAVEKRHNHAMIFLADMPCISSAVIDRLLDRHVMSGAVISAIRGEGRPAHPVVFRRDLYPELKRLQGDQGARCLVYKYGGSLCLVEPATGYDSRDIDTPEDYAAFQTA